MSDRDALPSRPAPPGAGGCRNLVQLPGAYAVCRLAAGAPVPDWVGGEFVSITRTADELSIVCAEDRVPPGTTSEGGWRGLRVDGVLDFALVGVLASLVVPLAEAGISVFAVSTHATDYLFVRKGELAAAILRLEQAGFRVRRGVG